MECIDKKGISFLQIRPTAYQAMMLHIQTQKILSRADGSGLEKKRLDPSASLGEQNSLNYFLLLCRIILCAAYGIAPIKCTTINLCIQESADLNSYQFQTIKYS